MTSNPKMPHVPSLKLGMGHRASRSSASVDDWLPRDIAAINQTYFTVEQTETELTMTLEESKALGITGQLSFVNAIKPANSSAGNSCSQCKKSFILLFRKRYACALCTYPYCDNCLQNHFKLCYTKCSPNTFENIVGKLGDLQFVILNESKTIHMKVCKGCFGYLKTEVDAMQEKVVAPDEGITPRKSSVRTSRVAHSTFAFNNNLDRSFLSARDDYTLLDQSIEVRDKDLQYPLIRNGYLEDLEYGPQNMIVMEYRKILGRDLEDFHDDSVTRITLEFDRVLELIDLSNNKDNFLGLNVLITICSYEGDLEQPLESEHQEEEELHGPFVKVIQGAVFEKLVIDKNAHKKPFEFPQFMLLDLNSNNKPELPTMDDLLSYNSKKRDAASGYQEPERKQSSYEYNSPSVNSLSEADESLDTVGFDDLGTAGSILVQRFNRESVNVPDARDTSANDDRYLSKSKKELGLVRTSSRQTGGGETASELKDEAKKKKDDAISRCYVSLMSLTSKKLELEQRVMETIQTVKKPTMSSNSAIKTLQKTLNNANPVQSSETLIVFSRNALPFTMFDKMVKGNITTVMPMSQDELNLLSYACGCKISDYQAFIDRQITQSSKYVGALNWVKIHACTDQSGKTFKHLILVEKKMAKIKSEKPVTEEATCSAGLVIFGPDKILNDKFRDLLSTNLAYLYYLHVEKSIQKHESTLFEKTEGLSSKIDRRQVGNFMSKLSEFLPNLQQLLGPNGQVHATKLTLTRLKLDTAYKDIDDGFKSKCSEFVKLATSSKFRKLLEKPTEFDQFTSMLQGQPTLQIFNHINMTKVDFFAAFVGKPTSTARKVYSKEDRTLEIFLRNRFGILDKVVPESGIKLKHHVSLIYLAGTCIKISADDYEGEMNYPNMKRKSNQDALTSLIRLAWLRHYEETDKQTGSKQAKTKKTTDTGEKDSKKSENISCGIICDVCHLKLSKTFELDNHYRNVSFLMFLLNLACQRSAEAPNQKFGSAPEVKMPAFYQSTPLSKARGHNRMQSGPVPGLDLSGLTEPAKIAHKQIEQKDQNNSGLCSHTKQARAFFYHNSVIKFTRYDLSLFDLKLRHYTGSDSENKPTETTAQPDLQIDEVKGRKLRQRLKSSGKCNRWLRVARLSTEACSDWDSLDVFQQEHCKYLYRQEEETLKHFINLANFLEHQLLLLGVLLYFLPDAKPDSHNLYETWVESRKKHPELLHKIVGLHKLGLRLMELRSKQQSFLDDPKMRLKVLQMTKAYLERDPELNKDHSAKDLGPDQLAKRFSEDMRSILMDALYCFLDEYNELAGKGANKAKLVSQFSQLANHISLWKRLEEKRIKAVGAVPVEPLPTSTSIVQMNKRIPPRANQNLMPPSSNHGRSGPRQRDATMNYRIDQTDGFLQIPPKQGAMLSLSRVTSQIDRETSVIDPCDLPSNRETRKTDWNGMETILEPGADKTRLIEGRRIRSPSLHLHDIVQKNPSLCSKRSKDCSIFKTSSIPDPRIEYLSTMLYEASHKDASQTSLVKPCYKQFEFGAQLNNKLFLISNWLNSDYLRNLDYKSREDREAKLPTNKIPLVPVMLSEKYLELLKPWKAIAAAKYNKTDIRSTENIVSKHSLKVIYNQVMTEPTDNPYVPLRSRVRHVVREASLSPRGTRRNTLLGKDYTYVYSDPSDSSQKNQRPVKEQLEPKACGRLLTEKDLVRLVQHLETAVVETERDFKERSIANQSALYSVVIIEPTLFLELRKEYGINEAEYVASLRSSESYSTTGGKTESEFFKTKDKKYIAKEIPKIEFDSYVDQRVVSDYIKYLKECKSKGQGSLLCMILGMYEVKLAEQGSTYIIVMDNLFYGLEKEPEQKDYDIKVFDLKGSKKKRYLKEAPSGKTLLDTNFDIERNGDVLTIKAHPQINFFETLERDVFFLRDQKRVDYSLLLIISPSKQVVRCGIIDYLREYDIRKRMEYLAKKIGNLGKDPTIIAPEDYASRFYDSMVNRIAIIHDPSITTESQTPSLRKPSETSPQKHD